MICKQKCVHPHNKYKLFLGLGPSGRARKRGPDPPWPADERMGGRTGGQKYVDKGTTSADKGTHLFPQIMSFD